MNTATKAQLRAITLDHPLIVAIAGPGAGKTWTLIQRILRLVSTGTEPRAIAAITFTNAGAREMRERLGDLTLGYIGTLHGLALLALRKHGAALGYSDRLTVLDEARATALLKTCAREMGCKSSAKALAEARTNFNPNAPKTALSLAVVDYRRRMRAMSAGDFDTLLTDFLELAPCLPEFDHLIVDEFQDSGPVDAAIYAALRAKNRFFVGDPDQAIYGFRGARMANILDAANAPGAEVIRLEENFRCAAPICAAANALVAHNTQRLPKTTHSDRQGPALAMLGPWQTGEDEALGVVRELQARIAAGQDPHGMAVLSRTNALAHAIAETARTMGLPIRERRKVDAPRDWTLATAAVAMLTNPTDFAVESYLRARFGELHAAQAIKTAALEQRHGLLGLVSDYTRGVDVRGLPTALARLTVSRESIERVMGLADEAGAVEMGAVTLALSTSREEAEEGEGVVITTMHAAKGREWPLVVLVGLEQEITPGGKTRDVEEERRLVFVGITRAKDTLLLSHSMNRRQNFGRKEMVATRPSQFISEALTLEN